MKRPIHSLTRKKAVWGLTSTLAAFMAVALGAAALSLTATSVSAAEHHRLHGEAGRPGRPNKFVDRDYRLDGELSRRAKNAKSNTTHVSTVIVELKPGAQVPPQFQRF